MSAVTSADLSAITTDRAYGALIGVAIGDALGMPTQSLSRETIRLRYGQITDFIDADADQPIAPNMRACSVTDDTEQAVLLGQLLLAGGGHVEPEPFAAALLAWEQSMIDRGSLDLLGPSTKAALSALQSGTSITEAGRYGTTNGAAMRIAPVGVAFRPGPALLAAVVEASRVTHHTGLGISGAAAIAAAVSTGVSGGDVASALDAAVEAAREGESRGHWVAGASIPARLVALRPHARTLDAEHFADYLYEVVGSSVQSQESVVSALLIADRYADEPFEGLGVAASLGGDTDTIAAMAGAVLGACHGAGAFPASARTTVEFVNNLDLASLARRLLEIRTRTA